MPSSAVTMPRVSRAASSTAASSRGSTNDMLTTRSPIPSSASRSAASSARDTMVPAAMTVTSSPSVRRRLVAGPNGAPAGVTAGTLKRGMRR
jgi:hypothetical protein